MIGDVGLCSHHGVEYGDDWARENRVMCDFIHRGIVGLASDDCVFGVLPTTSCVGGAPQQVHTTDKYPHEGLTL